MVDYGDWPSDWSAERAVAAGRDFSELKAAHGGLAWVEFDPASARSRLYLWRDGVLEEPTAPDGSVRSRVYEYGGGACCVTLDGLAWVDETDQQVRRWRAGRAAQVLGVGAQCRYGDLAYVDAWDALLAVEESHGPTGVVHRIVRLDADGARRVLVEGADFYAAPRAAGQGRRLAWIEWDRPHQPWTETRLGLAENGRTRCLAGAGGGESIQQPRFDPAGRLHWLSDRDGWWRPCAEVALAGRFADADHAGAPWQLGACSYLPLGEGRLLLSRVEVGGGQLFLREADGSERRLAADWNRFAGLAADARAFYCIAAAAGRLPALLAIHRDDLRVEVLRGGERPLAEDDLSHPQAFVYGLGNGENGHGFFYPPRNARRRVDPRRPAPLLVWLHGGPTSMHSPAFDAGLQFWTQRGFAVAALNYRGSSGYGRAYRQRLRGQWGRLELRDIEAALARLDAEGRIDRARVFVRGASAGGYSALRALACLDGLRGGASLYGVSDPLALARCTHKFEGDYLDWLIGDPQRQRRRYLARSPVLQVGRIRAPVVFFQGGLDAVVVPEQTEAMVAGLRRSGVRVECHRYPQERHGFRQPANRAHALLAEWRFYLGLLED